MVAARVQPGRGAVERAGVLRDAGEPHDLAEGLHRDARPEDRPGRRDPPVRRPAPGRRPGRHRRSRVVDARWTGAVEDRSGDEFDQFRRHAGNFLDCVRSRRDPISDLESGHRVVTACHLANLSLRLGRKLRWDADRETVVGDPEADAMLERPYRSPWDAELKTLLGRGDSCD